MHMIAMITLFITERQIIPSQWNELNGCHWEVEFLTETKVHNPTAGISRKVQIRRKCEIYLAHLFLDENWIKLRKQEKTKRLIELLMRFSLLKKFSVRSHLYFAQ